MPDKRPTSTITSVWGGLAGGTCPTKKEDRLTMQTYLGAVTITNAKKGRGGRGTRLERDSNGQGGAGDKREGSAETG